ncbi:family 3 O-methyltransferase [Rhizopus microsporus var. microsporus]|uniref:Family 3 O-methyltransferase n=2 Tax=Rhizopus microsporus TaxID=58291 RepID=A0A2G4SPZ6_RHIZD|nr:family 3 O-methyltransferase [Rhizopus microsporus ATCC 52813]ORE00916.1 family 3 O-methyltransferase [Rhizopus microsporus var. microsporus]PHZ10833.1 family 3 O-methyltransferase [Rhizopus microsporus ATCC 52813]
MAEQIWREIDDYTEELFFDQNDVVLQKTIELSNEAGLPSHNVSPTQGRMLAMLVQLKSAKRVLEIGTLGGYSTIYFGRALLSVTSNDAKLITLEKNPKCAAIAKENIERAGLSSIVDIKIGAAIDSLDELISKNEVAFDLIFIDADKINNTEYYKRAMQLAKSGTLIVADNVIRAGEVLNKSSQDPNVKGVRAFNNYVSRDDRVYATAIQTVGCKGYDGFAMILVK